MGISCVSYAAQLSGVVYFACKGSGGRVPPSPPLETPHSVRSSGVFVSVALRSDGPHSVLVRQRTGPRLQSPVTVADCPALQPHNTRLHAKSRALKYWALKVRFHQFAFLGVLWLQREDGSVAVLAAAVGRAVENAAHTGQSAFRILTVVRWAGKTM